LNIIQLLPENVANQIAAGEVIQRPSSVVKELLENSLDSGATEIKLYIQDSGKTLINIVDNGCGMSSQDVILCIQRHATSKIKIAADLFNILTMGFRGEAMSSIAAISNIEIETKQLDNNIGFRLNVEGGIIKEQKECSTLNGTSIKIKNLFFNVPARRKFLKSDNIEMRHIYEEFSRVALANPNIKMHLSHNKQEILFLNASNFRQRIVNLIGIKKNEQLVPILEETSLVNISGFIAKPNSAKKTRGEQYLFVNGRFIKSFYLQNAIFKAFEGLIATDYFPSFFINLIIDPKKLDINIHPNKTEIKFQDEKAIYSILRSTVKRSLGQYNISPSIDFLQENSFNINSNSNTPIIEPKINIDSSYNPFNSDAKKITSKEINTNIKFLDDNLLDIDYKFLQIKNKFILRFCNDEIILIHQKRAHQRILFEHFKSKEKNKNYSSQILVFPIEIVMSNNDIEIIQLISKELKDIGFEYIASHKKLIIKAIPTDSQEKNIENLIETIIEQYKISNKVKLDNKHKIALALASSMSILETQTLNLEEMKKINLELFKCESPSISPSGKLTVINLNMINIEEKFN